MLLLYGPVHRMWAASHGKLVCFEAVDIRVVLSRVHHKSNQSPFRPSNELFVHSPGESAAQRLPANAHA